MSLSCQQQQEMRASLEPAEGQCRDVRAARHPPDHPCLQGHQEAQLALDLPHGHENLDHHEDLGDLLFLAHQ